MAEPAAAAVTDRPLTLEEKKAAARAHWDTEIAAGRPTPNGVDLAKAAGQEGDDTGVFRRWAREWAAEATNPEAGATNAS